ncbi:hypothetical protein NEMBOFW57_004121 [Staphylotrichum longicolle]|uniref:MPN domain-containing protein n=1 Tax=Staphylotrichum longicolle TaxID=669026 RepID=A0AAD4F6J7_9PEZI|nr:hypothetical protein NEMBOFW57_004121 [Staphylotrichum longicolle]
MNITDLSVGSRPMSARELTDKAKEFDWNPRIPFKYWARAAETIHHEGQVYLREGNLPQAYLVLFRYSTLVLQYLTKHPEAKSPEAKKALKPLQKRIPRVIELLESLRPEIEDTYDQWLKIQDAHRDAARNASLAASSPYARHAANDPALSWSYGSPANILDASDYQDLAVELAKKEMSRRRRAGGMSEEEEHRRRGAGYWGDWNKAPEPKAAPLYMDDDELRRQMEATRRQLDRPTDYSKDHDDDEAAVRPSTYLYPSINKSMPLPYERPASKDRELLPSSALADYSPAREVAPSLPPKSLAEPAKQKRVTFRPAAYLENGDPIRPVFLPSALRHKFLQIASDNTRRGLEMCGMLCGTAVNNALFISHLVIPQQKCTSDTCETENESVMLDFCIENDLIVIGWIHTHPTQTCFMSSRDLHTQAGYQVMMPESIAIVCAPRFEPSWGIFRLTNPPGLPHILSCQRTETFHQHSVDNLYVEAGQPAGHVYESKSLEFDVCDLRDAQ